MTSIQLNGASYICRNPSPRLSDLIRDLSLEGKRVAIERNGEIVPRSKHPETVLLDDPLIIAGRAYRSRLLVGTGKYKDFDQTRAAIDASGAEIVTVAIRRTNIGQNAGEPSLLDYLPPSQFTLLPNTAGCYTADDAVRTLKLARELLDGHKLVKLEVLGDPHTLFPNVRETIVAAEALIRDGFDVMVYTSDDPIIARELEAVGCVAIMPLASLIGSGMGILNPWNLKLIIEQSKVPVLVDAGVGTASDAAVAMELGCAGVLMNTAIALAQRPVLMAGAMKKAIEAGREAYVAGRMPRKLYAASPSSPAGGLIT
jgi:thiazole synthase